MSPAASRLAGWGGHDIRWSPFFAMSATAAAAGSLVGEAGRALAKHSGRTPREQALEVFSYVVSFAAFYLFVYVAMKLVKSPNFR